MSSEERIAVDISVDGSANPNSNDHVGIATAKRELHNEHRTIHTEEPGANNSESELKEQSGSTLADSNEAIYKGFTCQGEFIVSESDKKEYRLLFLDNGLRVLLIHEPASLEPQPVQPASGLRHRRQVSGSSDSGSSGSSRSGDSERDEDSSSSSSSGSGEGPACARRSAAALCVGSGSADEGSELPGLAHFLEHMVFMGSAKYPKENDFDAYVSERGGETNAWTDMERTLFHFDCRPDSFPECLDRFANFFVKPLLRSDSLKREVEAVHSEFEEACSSLSSQLEYFVGCLATPGHPLAGFKWGNRRSLWQAPRASGVDVRARLQELRLQHYRAANMTAVLQSRLSLDELEASARAAFAGLPSGTRPPPPPSMSEQRPFGPGFLGRAYHLLPVKQAERLRLAWACPAVQGPADRECQPHRILGFCLAHEGPGSLADCMRREGLAVDLVAGVDSRSGLCDSTAGSLMELTVKLTPAGLEQWQRVVQLVHCYVGMLGQQLPQLERIFAELHDVERNAFRFVEEAEPAENAEQVAQNLMKLPQPLCLLGDRMPLRFDLESVRQYWLAMRPSNACVLIAASNFPADTDSCRKVTDWFEIHYSDIPLDPDTVAHWERCVDSPDPQVLAACQLHLPPPNQFIAGRFDVASPEKFYKEIGIANLPQFPIRLTLGDPAADEFGVLYYFKERKFKTPRAVVRVSLESPVLCDSLESSTLARLWIYVLNFQLHRDVYAACEAGLSYDVVLVEPLSILIELEGFDDKLFVLHSAILDKWSQLGKMMNAGDPALKFDSAKEEVRKTLVNLLLSPKRLASNIRHHLLDGNRYLASDQLACLEALNLSDLASFHHRLLSKAFWKLYVHGNHKPEDAKFYFQRCLSLLPAHCQPASVENTVASLPTGRNGVRVSNLHSGDVNSLLIEEFQLAGSPSLRDNVLAELMLHVMSEPCFDFLRTRHQLGYHVACRTSRRLGCINWHLLVASQADKFAMDLLQRRVDEFLLNFACQLRSLPQDQFDNHVQAAVDEVLAEDSAMADEADRYWTEIADGGLLFDRRVREADALKQVKFSELLEFCQRTLAAGCRRSFAVQIEGSSRKCLHDGGGGAGAGFHLPLTCLQAPAACDDHKPNSELQLTDRLADFRAGLQFQRALPIVQ